MAAKIVLTKDTKIVKAPGVCFSLKIIPQFETIVGRI